MFRINFDFVRINIELIEEGLIMRGCNYCIDFQLVVKCKTLIQDCRLHLLQDYLRPSDSVFLDFSEGRTQTLSIRTAVFHFVQNVFLEWRAYPNPFNKSLRALLGFLICVCFCERAHIASTN